ncbi:MAG: H-NS histone family protein [Xanthomonadales bacterium]|nr:H-NS histone family protein [Xanthomonadales bacterium]
MAIDLKNLNVDQLEELISRAKARIMEVKEETVNKLREELAAKARAHGFDISDLFGGRGKAAPRKAKSSVKPKYRHPGNPDVTWSGRGRQPVWVREALASGKSLDDLAI